MRESIMSPSTHPGSVGKFRPEQIAQRTTWRRVPDEQTAIAAMHVIHVVPHNGSTITALNPLDPGTVADGGADADGMGYGWLHRPHGYGMLFR
jgi:hypothetical protein